MKILYKIIAVFALIVVALLFLLPIIYKSEIIDLTKKEINKNVNAEIEFADINFGLIKSFPNFNLSIHDLSLKTKGDFNKDTLAKIETISLSINLFSVFSGETYEINRIKLIKPEFRIIVLENNKTNYDIALKDEENTIPTTSKAETAFSMNIRKFSIVDGNIYYDDKDMDLQVEMKGINHSLSGKLSNEDVVLVSNTRVNEFNLVFDNIRYFSDVSTVYNANINADLKNEIFTLGKNELILNKLKLKFDGSVSLMGEEDINLVLSFKSADTKFQSILSMVPIVYSKNFEGLKTEGNFSVSGFIKGIYNETSIPSFNMSINVDNAMFKYPDLPKAINNINITSHISNNGEGLDNTIIDISQFSLEMGGAPLNATLNISHPISDPELIASLETTQNLNDIKDLYPLGDEDDLNGELKIDIKLDGRLSSIEQEKYEEFSALGYVLATNISYKSKEFIDPILIEKAQLNFSPQYLNLVSFNSKIGKSDLSAKGKITNYVAYYLGKGQLNASMDISSAYLNIDELFADEVEAMENSSKTNTENPKIEQEQYVSSEIIEVPGNINFQLNADMNKLVYDKIEMQNVKGKMIIKEHTVFLDNLIMDAVDGQMIVDGSYNSKDINNPLANLNVQLKNLNIPKAYNKFAIMKKYIPIAKKTEGIFSANFQLNTVLDSKMTPVYNTLNGQGSLSTSAITVSDLNSLSQIAESLKLQALNNLNLKPIYTSFSFTDGKLNVNPTKFVYNNINGEFSGSTAFDQSIDYNMNLEIPREMLGKDANDMVENLLSQLGSYGENINLPSTIPVNIKIDGSLENPKIKTSLNKMSSNTAKQTEDIVKDEIKKHKQDLGEEAQLQAKKIIADADKAAKRIIREAERNAKFINDNAKDVVAKLNAEANRQGNKLIEEGKKNGFVAEAAAKEAAKNLRTESQKQGDELIKTASEDAQSLVNEAKKLADQMKKEAELQAADLLK